jgi:hypothetical protein
LASTVQLLLRYHQYLTDSDDNEEEDDFGDTSRYDMDYSSLVSELTDNMAHEK